MAKETKKKELAEPKAKPVADRMFGMAGLERLVKEACGIKTLNNNGTYVIGW